MKAELNGSLLIREEKSGPLNRLLKLRFAEKE
jgi:hypothetical protein